MKLLVFLHGLGQTPQTWQDQVTALPAGLKAVAPWIRGTRPGRPLEFSVQEAADEVLALLTANGVDQMALCGVGMGAVVALDAAVREPDTVSHLVLASGQAHPPVSVNRLQKLALRATPAGRFAAVGIDKRHALRVLDELARMDYRDRLGQVTARTLVLHGADDRPGRAAAAELHAGIPGSRLEEVAGAGATPHNDQPGRFNDLLYDFLGD